MKHKNVLDNKFCTLSIKRFSQNFDLNFQIALNNFFI